MLPKQIQRLEDYLEAKRLRAKERFVSQQQYEKNDMGLQTPTFIPVVMGLWYNLLASSTTLVSTTTCKEKNKYGHHDTQQCLHCIKQAQATQASQAQKLQDEVDNAAKNVKKFKKKVAKMERKEVVRREAIRRQGLDPVTRRAEKKARRQARREAENKALRAFGFQVDGDRLVMPRRY